MSATPLTIRIHERDNVAIVANDGGLAAGSVLPSGLVLRDRVPQGHKVALTDIAADAPVQRYGVPIGHALKDIAAGSWVHERLLKMPAARGLENLPIATVKPPPSKKPCLAWADCSRRACCSLPRRSSSITAIRADRLMPCCSR